MKTNNTSELVFLLDRSGSMAGLESDTVGGFNAMIRKQKQEDGVCFVSTILFDNESKVLHDRVPLADVPTMTEREYTVRGCTALLDALGDAIQHIANIHKYARREDVPARTLFVITTDGMENASRRYTATQIKEMIGQKKETCGWEFLFIGANIDAVATAAAYGIDSDRAVNYHADSKGTSAVYKAVGKAVACMRCSVPLDSAWREDIEADFQSRG